MEIDQLVSALLKAKKNFTAVRMDGYNPHFKSHFATLKSMQEATLTQLTSYGLVVLQFPSAIEGQPALTTILAHESGQMMQSTALLSLVKQDPQAQGSALSYMRRYAYGAVLGLVAEDEDDGNAASEAPPSRTTTQPAPSNAEGIEALTKACQSRQMSKDNVAALFKREFGCDPKNASTDDLKAFAALIKEGAYS